jgi:hypothetical protein
MSEKAGPVRSSASINEALAEVRETLSTYRSVVSADVSSRRSVNRTFLVRDILTTAYVYLAAMADYVTHGGQSRGSVLYTEPEGALPRAGHGPDPERELDLPEIFRFRLDDGALDDEIQEAAWVGPGGTPGAPQAVDEHPWQARSGADPDDPAGEAVFRWRPRRPIPADDDFFETVWREFREHGNVY